MRRSITAVLAAAVTFALAGCGSDSDGESSGDTAAAAPESVALTATEFKFDPAAVTVDTAGNVTFTVSNDGQQTHALEIEGNGVEEETDSIAAGESGTLTVDLEPGEYGHREQGMEGKLTVGGSSSGAGSTTGGTDTGDSGYYGG